MWIPAAGPAGPPAAGTSRRCRRLRARSARRRPTSKGLLLAAAGSPSPCRSRPRRAGRPAMTGCAARNSGGADGPPGPCPQRGGAAAPNQRWRRGGRGLRPPPRVRGPGRRRARARDRAAALPPGRGAPRVRMCRSKAARQRLRSAEGGAAPRLRTRGPRSRRKMAAAGRARRRWGGGGRRGGARCLQSPTSRPGKRRSRAPRPGPEGGRGWGGRWRAGDGREAAQARGRHLRARPPPPLRWAPRSRRRACARPPAPPRGAVTGSCLRSGPRGPAGRPAMRMRPRRASGQHGATAPRPARQPGPVSTARPGLLPSRRHSCQSRLRSALAGPLCPGLPAGPAAAGSAAPQAASALPGSGLAPAHTGPLPQSRSSPPGQPLAVSRGCRCPASAVRCWLV